MKRKTRLLSLLLIFVLCLSVLPLGAAAAETTGWQQQANGTWRYLSDGQPLTNQWKKIDSSWYYFDEAGAMVASDYVLYNGHWYYFGVDGRMITGWRFITARLEDGSSYSYWTYFYSNGQEVDEGWEKIGGKWYYFHEGEMMTGWLNSDPTYYTEEQGTSGDWYYLDPESGSMVTGWKKLTQEEDDGSSFTYWTYFLSDGRQAIHCWQKVGGVWYWFDDFGAMISGGVYQIGSKYYFFKDSGAMYTGWKYLDDAWRYFGSSGWMTQDGQVCSGGKYYYIYNYGMIKNKWADNRYYGSDGAMLVNTSRTINGTYYTFDSRGIPDPWVSPEHDITSPIYRMMYGG